MAKTKAHKPEAVIRHAVGKHKLVASRWHDGTYTFSCTLPGLAEKHHGCRDSAAAEADFYARATGAAPQPPGAPQ
jgi:hypothetical protein